MKSPRDGKEAVLLIVIVVLWLCGGWKGWPIVSRLFRSEPVPYQISSAQVVPDGIEVLEPVALSSLSSGSQRFQKDGAWGVYAAPRPHPFGVLLAHKPFETRRPHSEGHFGF